MPSAVMGGSGGASLPVADSTEVVKGSADATKQLRFEVDGFTTGTTRVVTFPDANITVARTDAAQTFTGNQTYSGRILIADGTGAAPSIAFSGETGMGFYKAASGTTRWTPDGGTNYVDFRTNALSTNGFGGIMYTAASATAPSLAPDVIFDADTGIGRAGADQLSLIAGGVETLRVTTTATIGTIFKATGVTFANLPASPSAGMIATVTDSNTATWGATIAGGGANTVLAFYNGTNWTVAGK